MHRKSAIMEWMFVDDLEKKKRKIRKKLSTWSIEHSIILREKTKEFQVLQYSDNIRLHLKGDYTWSTEITINGCQILLNTFSLSCISISF